MQENQSLQKTENTLALQQPEEIALVEFRRKCQNFISLLDRQPPANSIDKTPDGNASTVLISHIEMTLDELFFGLWDTVDFRYTQIANEIVGSILLVVTHPVTGKEIKRTGAAAIQIMVDATPEELKYNAADSKAEADRKKKARNKWALDVENKKPSALDMSFPKLKAECLKNAAQSLGRLFGRDLNRKKFDTFNPLIKNGTKQEENPQSSAVVSSTRDAINKAQARTI